LFWDAASAIDPEGAAANDQAATRPYSNPDDLKRLWTGCGLRDVSTGALVVGADYADFEDLWDPLVIPDGGPGRYIELLPRPKREAICDELRRRLGDPVEPFRLTARAWYALGYAP
jgi:hypothetical protein